MLAYSPPSTPLPPPPPPPPPPQKKNYIIIFRHQVFVLYKTISFILSHMHVHTCYVFLMGLGSEALPYTIQYTFVYVQIVLPSLYSLVGLCALSVDNDNGFIAYPGSSQVSARRKGREGNLANAV